MMAETDAGVIYAIVILCGFVGGLLIGEIIKDDRHTRQKIRDAERADLERQYQDLQKQIEREAAAHRKTSHLQREWTLVTARLIGGGYDTRRS